MKQGIKKIDFNKIYDILREEDLESVYQKTNLVPDSGKLYKMLEGYVMY